MTATTIRHQTDWLPTATAGVRAAETAVAVPLPRQRPGALLVAAVALAAVGVAAAALGVDPGALAEVAGHRLAQSGDQLQTWVVTLDQGLRNPFAFGGQLPAGFDR